jgi:hypothetical protein
VALIEIAGTACPVKIHGKHHPDGIIPSHQ